MIPSANQSLEIAVRKAYVEMQIPFQEGDWLLIPYESFDRLRAGQPPLQWKRLLKDLDTPAALASRLSEKSGQGAGPDFLIGEVSGAPRKTAYLQECGFPPDDTSHIRTLHNFDEMKSFTNQLVDQADQLGYSIKFQKNFRLIMSELLTNAIVHGNL